MHVYKRVRVYADKSVRYDARPNVPGQTQCHEALHATLARNRSRFAFARGSHSLAVRIRSRFAIARGSQSHAVRNCRTRSLSS